MKTSTLLFMGFIFNTTPDLCAMTDLVQAVEQRYYPFVLSFTCVKNVMAKIYASIDNGWHYFLSHGIDKQVEKEAKEIELFLRQPRGLYFTKNNPLHTSPIRQEILEYMMKHNKVIQNIIEKNVNRLEAPYNFVASFPFHKRISTSPNKIYIAEGFSNGVIQIEGVRLKEVDLPGDIKEYKSEREDFELYENNRPLIVGIKWSPDSTILLSELNDNTTSIWHRETRKRISSLPYGDIRYNATMTHLIGGAKNGDVVLLQADTYEVVKTFKGHTGWVRTVCWSPDGKYIASGSFDKTIRIWQVATGRCVLAWSMSYPINYLEWFENNHLYAIDKISYESFMYEWNMKDILTLGRLNENQMLLFEVLKYKDDRLNTIQDNTGLINVIQSLPKFIKESLVTMNIVPHLFMVIKDGKQEIPFPARQ